MLKRNKAPASAATPAEAKDETDWEIRSSSVKNYIMKSPISARQNRTAAKKWHREECFPKVSPTQPDS